MTTTSIFLIYLGARTLIYIVSDVVNNDRKMDYCAYELLILGIAGIIIPLAFALSDNASLIPYLIIILLSIIRLLMQYIKGRQSTNGELSQKLNKQKVYIYTQQLFIYGIIGVIYVTLAQILKNNYLIIISIITFGVIVYLDLYYFKNRKHANEVAAQENCQSSKKTTNLSLTTERNVSSNKAFKKLNNRKIRCAQMRHRKNKIRSAGSVQINNYTSPIK